MSVFIHIGEVEPSESLQVDQIALKVKSRDTELIVQPVVAFPTAQFDCSLIASTREQHLQIELTLIQLLQDEPQTLQSEISFSPLLLSPQQEIYQKIVFEDKATMGVNFFLTRKKNFLGPIEFYEYRNVTTSSVIIPKTAELKPTLRASVANYPKAEPHFTSSNQELTSSSQEVQLRSIEKETHIKFSYMQPKAVSSEGLFFCCGERNEEQKFQVQDEEVRGEKRKVQFYKGACQNKNMFSMCDAPIDDNKFTVVQDYYRDN